jgi:hypothetical protein
MTFTPAKDQPIPLSQIPNLGLTPGRAKGGAVHRATVYRWASVGLGPKRIRLTTIQCGNTKCTTPRLLRKFFRQIAVAKGNGQGSAAPLKKFIKSKVETELDREGL